MLVNKNILNKTLTRSISNGLYFSQVFMQLFSEKDYTFDIHESKFIIFINHFQLLVN